MKSFSNASLARCLVLSVAATGLAAFSLPASAAKVPDIDKNCHSQGASVTKGGFVYTSWCGDEKQTSIIRCDRKGATVKNCKKILTDYFEHASVIDGTWGSKYYLIYNSGTHDGIQHPQYCINITTGKIVGEENCTNTATLRNRKLKSDQVAQGFTVYGNYYLRGYSSKNNAGKNRIDVYKGNKVVKTLWVGHNKEELEDVSIDGDTGAIYFTTATNNQVKLYRYSGYKLPKYSKLKK